MSDEPVAIDDDAPIRAPVEERRGLGGRMAAGMPAEKSMDFAGSTKRLMRRMGPDGATRSSSCCSA